MFYYIFNPIPLADVAPFFELKKMQKIISARGDNKFS